MSVRPKLLFVLVYLFAALYGCAVPDKTMPTLETVANVDLQRYVGTWYEIARLPHRFQRGCYASRAVYTLLDDGLIGVYNECRKGAADGPIKSVQGKARVVDKQTNAKLEVSFFWPFWGDYWIIDLDSDYQWAVVGHPNRKFLWILGRQKTIDEEVMDGIKIRLLKQGYDLQELLVSPLD
jgi:apolipoprotein D and lipocalin family protein